MLGRLIGEEIAVHTVHDQQSGREWLVMLTPRSYKPLEAGTPEECRGS
jgi:hypothetical protein